MAVCPNFDESTETCLSPQWKINYLQTYTGDFDVILTQRYHYCGIHKNKEVHVFYGGIRKN